MVAAPDAASRDPFGLRATLADPPNFTPLRLQPCCPLTSPTIAARRRDAVVAFIGAWVNAVWRSCR